MRRILAVLALVALALLVSGCRVGFYVEDDKPSSQTTTP